MSFETNDYAATSHEQMVGHLNTAKRVGTLTMGEATKSQPRVHRDPAVRKLHGVEQFKRPDSPKYLDETATRQGQANHDTLTPHNTTEFDTATTRQLETLFQELRANPNLGDSVGLGGEWRNGNTQLHAESGRNADHQWEETLTATPAAHQEHGVQLVRSFDLTNGGDEELASFKVRRLETVTDPTTHEPVRQVTEYALDPSLAANEVRTAFVRTEDNPAAPLEMSALDFEAQVSAITTELQQGMQQSHLVETFAQAA